MSRLCVTVLGSTDLTHAPGFVLLSCLSPRVSHYAGQCRMFLVTGQSSVNLVAMNLKGIGRGTGFFTCSWEYPPAACHAKSFPCWASCQGHILSINCHLCCLLAAVHQISVCSSSHEGSCNKSHTCSSVRWYLPPFSPHPSSAYLQAPGRSGGSFYFLDRHLTHDIWVQLSWECCSRQVTIQLRGKKGKSGMSWFSLCGFLLVEAILVEVEALVDLLQIWIWAEVIWSYITHV